MPASRSSPPKRRPLHERSDSQTNELPSSSIRLVDHSYIYDRTSFPSRTSQILIPPGESSTVSGSHPLLSQQSLNHPLPLSNPIRPTKYEGIGPSKPEIAYTVEKGQVSNLDGTVFDISTSHPQTENNVFDVEGRPSSVLLPEKPSTALNASNPKRLTSTTRLPPFSSLSQENPAIRAGPSQINPSFEISLSRTSDAQSPVDHPNQPSNILHGSVNQNTIPSYPSIESLPYQMRAGRANNSGRRSVSYSAFPPVTPPNNNNPSKNIPPNAPYPLGSAGSKSVRTPSGSRQRSRPATARQVESRSTTDTSAILQYPVIYPPSTQGSWATSSGDTSERTRMSEGRLPNRWNTGSSSGGYSVGRIGEGDGNDGRRTEVPQLLAQSPRALPQGLVGVALTSDGEQTWPPNIGAMQGNNMPSTIRLVSGPHVRSSRTRGTRRRSVNNRESYPSDRTRDTRRKRDETRLAEAGTRDSMASNGIPAWAKYVDTVNGLAEKMS